MNLLNKLTIKNLKLNKKRTIVTIIGIMLSVSLITSVATMYSSMIKSLISFEVNEKGNFHVAYYKVPINEIPKIKNTRGIKDVYLTQDIGYAKLEKSKNEYKPYIFVKGFTKESLEQLSIKLIDGRLPENEDEIIIPSHLKTNGRVTMNIGDTITLEIGKRINGDGNELYQNSAFNKDNEEQIIDTITKKYKVVGIIERPATNIEIFEAPGYTFVTYMDETKMNGIVNAYAKYTKTGSKEYLKVTSSILEVKEESFRKAYLSKPNELSEEELKIIFDDLSQAKYEIEMNTYLLTLENNPLDESTVGSMGGIVVVVIIIILVTSIFCIRNSFDISITEKIKQYGMLRSIGATKKQIKNNVFYEATILGLIGIPLGLLLGFLASYILVIICNLLLGEMLIDNLKILLYYSYISFIISLLLGFTTIYLSAFRSAKKASKVTPIDSIRNSANIKINSKKIKCPKIIKKVFKIGGEISYKNMKRNKKKYRTTTISIVVSVAVFIALSFFIKSAFNVVKSELKMYDYNIALHKYNEVNKDFELKANDTLSLDNIDDYAVYKSQNIMIKNPKYNNEYNNYGFETDYDENCMIIAMEDYQYKKYLNKLNISYNNYQNMGILFDKINVSYINNDGKEAIKKVARFNYSDKDVITIYNQDTKLETELELYNGTKMPFALSDSGMCRLIVSEHTFNKIKSGLYEFEIFYQSNNPNKLQDDIDVLLQGEEYTLDNIEQNAKIMRNLFTLIAIFLYGFIIVITLIGITNIFNTITTNMELRKQEFAMLKSIGMTKHEFNSMIRFESIFIGFKALLFGIPIGIGLSYIIYLLFSMNEDNMRFVPPIFAIILASFVVYLLITMLMKYSMSKINKQNTIETIRNENI